jgi:uncharacterized protein YgfB (UPF0149 family)
MPAPSSTRPASDYDQLADRLELSHLYATAAEAHGILCGLICAGASPAPSIWIRELFATPDGQQGPDAETRRALQALAQQTSDEIEGPGFGFAPLLPAESHSLRDRAVGLYDWARGFVYGLGVAGLRQEDLSQEGREALADCADITRMDLDALGEGEENEEALSELQEFIRVAAMLIFEERGRAAGGARVQG